MDQRDRALEFIRELARADEAAAAVLAELDELARETEAIGARSLELEAFAVRLPAERERIAAEVGQAEGDVRAAADALARVKQELAAAEAKRDEERLAAARRREVSARDTLRMAERRIGAAFNEREELERSAESAERDATVLEERARTIATALSTRPQLSEHGGGPPAPGLAGVSAWATRARAALFVARAALVREREAVIRQANELGALVLGEPLTSASPSLVARRVAQSRGHG